MFATRIYESVAVYSQKKTIQGHPVAHRKKIYYNLTVSRKQESKKRMEATMRHVNLSKKAAVLSGLLLVIILCGAIYFAASSGKGNNIMTESVTLKNKLQLEQLITENLLDFDNVNNAMVHLETSDNKIDMAYIFIIASGEISDSEMNNISESIQNYFDSLQKDQIAITYVDSSYRVLGSPSV